MKMLVTGDLVINTEYDAINNVNQDVFNLFAQSDYNVVNLEAPVTCSNSLIAKTGPHLKSNQESTLNLLQHLNINIAALANNHIKDYDEKGVVDTIAFCNSNNIMPIGAGNNTIDASKTNILETEEGTIALINIAENEWASAGETTAGANGMNFVKDISAIQKAKRNNDFVFVIVHGGHEYYNLPSPRMQEQYRFYADQGADLVVGHHTHCINGYEVYNNTPIYYSLGNFVFTHKSSHEDWYTGLILEVDIVNSVLNTKLNVVVQEKNNFKISLASDDLKNKTIERCMNLNKIISDEELLKTEWERFVKQQEKTYLSLWSPKSFIKNRYLSAIFNRIKPTFSTSKGLTLYVNLMRCESHKNLSEEILESFINK